MKNEYNILFEKSGGRRGIWERRRSWDDKIKIDPKRSVRVRIRLNRLRVNSSGGHL
jgi:hypothetical protein